ncbi:alanine-glyoxylate transaminase/serine-glyoxylate transaminase/serine-pyruvate transaminase [Actinoalloteichus hoggarensis]|uniref:Soluble hydrogenase 42 kDa subunit n=1 Tax=Actinoalloteichus hoggarensis TaxID=1470176 RepID=A0A221W1G6_9PSEU|nr:aminotransferase class V-fold PLP-dependent enzyme [Actinoalloteichus hoggarensis]ASO19579.1 Soluble hydrogenase 42 kDa subunit [Actinoalloteichus hoggarensis]MBB5919714.1 alanine-glyoxylate transaminase/serine-glyoxylate transaminase/serine-pyruvate transaminase [Actinoalloteichus hoggarensis]
MTATAGRDAGSAARHESDAVGPAPLAMVVGPTRLAPSVLRRLADQPPPITDRRFLAEFREALELLRPVLGTTAAETFLVPGSGTAGMESLAASLLDPARPVLVLSTGMWGERWHELCTGLGLPSRVLRAAPGHGLDLDEVAACLRDRPYQAVLLTHVDSSSGVRADVATVTALAHRHGALSLVDGIAAAGAEEVRQDDWDVDAYLTSPPKALSGPGGLFLVALRAAAVDVLTDRGWTPRGYSLDLGRWLPVTRTLAAGDFAYFQTPPGALVSALAESLRLIVAEGPERIRRHETLAVRLRTGLAAADLRLFTADAADRAHGVTVLRTPAGVDAARLVAAVERHGVVLQAGTYPTAARRTVRIGHLGNHTAADVDRTLAALTAALAETARAEA